MTDDLKEPHETDTPELIELEDENGNTITFEFIDSVEYNGNIYYALIPCSEEEKDDEKNEFAVLKEESIEGEQFQLVTIDDDAEYAEVGDVFLERFREAFCEDE